MYGAIIGDLCGSIYEFNNRKTEQPEDIELTDPRCFVTDDTILTLAVAEALLGNRNYEAAVYKWANAYPGAGYGGRFVHWFLSDNPTPYNSWGNGSAMRVSPVGWAFDTLEITYAEAIGSAEITHNHPEGIKGAEATAAAIFLARTGSTKEEMKQYITENFGYDLDRCTADIRPAYKFDESCQGTVPEAIICFLESRDFTHAIQLAISLGGDTDTLACITGGIAEAFYGGVPEDLRAFADSKMDARMLGVAKEFCEKFVSP